MAYEMTDSGDRGIYPFTEAAQSSMGVEQCQGAFGLNEPHQGLIAAQKAVSRHFGSPRIFEAAAGQAVEPPSRLSNMLKSGPYESPVKLNIQITNVPEVSPAVVPKDWIKHLNAAFAAGAKSLKPVEQWLAKPNSVNDALIGVGPALDNAADYYFHTPANQIANDSRSVLHSARTALDNTANAIDHPITPEERANAAGSLMPLFFFEGNVKEPIHLETARQLGLGEMKQSELSELGIFRITRKAGAGGDWPVIDERPSPDVVRQDTSNGCVAAIGEMLSNGALRQAELFERVGTVPERLAKELGAEWNAGFFDYREREPYLDRLMHNGKPWGAELRDRFAHKVGMGHMVVVDGIDETDNLMIRDPQHGTRYEMTRGDFLKHWSDRAVYRVEKKGE